MERVTWCKFPYKSQILICSLCDAHTHTHTHTHTHRHPPPTGLGNKIKVPLLPEKDTPIDINIKAFIGQPNRYEIDDV